MQINNTVLTTAINVANEIFSQQTAEDVAVIKDHFGKAFNESKVIAEIAVKIILRLGNVKYSQDMRSLSPVDDLAFRAYDVYTERFGA